MIKGGRILGKGEIKRKKDKRHFYEIKESPENRRPKSHVAYRLIREHVESKSMLNTGGTVFEEILNYYPLNEINDGYTLNNFVIELLDKAITITKEDFRKTVQGRDIFLAKKEIEVIKKDREKGKQKKTKMIKRIVLDLGTKFARLQIAEISEVCDIKDEELIIIVVKEMIINNEIYAQYFSSTKSVAFNQQANIDEIDKLMETYEDWGNKRNEKI